MLNAPSVQVGTTATQAVFTVNLSAASTSTVTVFYGTGDGIATAASGAYTPTCGTLTFSPGQTSQTISVPVAGTTAPGASFQTIYIAVGNPANATIARQEAMAIIVYEPAAAAAYAPVSGTLFGPNGPSYLDVQQGQLGDCWLMASLAEVADRDPADISNMFTAGGTAVENGSMVSLYNVRFYNKAGVRRVLHGGHGTALRRRHITITRPTACCGWPWPRRLTPRPTGQALVTSRTVGSDSYAALNEGDAAWALQAITGKPASDFSINPTNIAAAWNAGELIVLLTSTPRSSYIVGTTGTP